MHPAASTGVSGWAEVGYIVGGLGFAIAVLREFRERRDRQRLRPVVIVHEDQRRHIEDRKWIAKVHLTNESATSAFNIRFGISVGDAEVGWKHDPADEEPSRLNVLEPGGRHPSNVPIKVQIPDEAVFACVGDPDIGRRYWARYQSPAGDWWYTSNPAMRSDDLVVKRVLSRRWVDLIQKRKHRQQVREGTKRMGEFEEEGRRLFRPPPEESGEQQEQTGGLEPEDR